MAPKGPLDTPEKDSEETSKAAVVTPASETLIVKELVTPSGIPFVKLGDGSVRATIEGEVWVMDEEGRVEGNVDEGRVKPGTKVMRGLGECLRAIMDDEDDGSD